MNRGEDKGGKEGGKGVSVHLGESPYAVLVLGFRL